MTRNNIGATADYTCVRFYIFVTFASYTFTTYDTSTEYGVCRILVCEKNYNLV